MAWLRLKRRELKLKRRQIRRRAIKRVDPVEILERYKLGKPIHYTECWKCSLFYKFEQCPYRFWLGVKLCCVRKAKEIDNRLVIGLRSNVIIQ